jgi:glycine/D-amino acid oxidase-like deaminating enzyme
MSLQVVIGAGPVGLTTALRLAAEGQQVRVITRSGTGPDADGVEPVAADAARAGRLASPPCGNSVRSPASSPPPSWWTPPPSPPPSASGPSPADQALTGTLDWWQNQGRSAARKE